MNEQVSRTIEPPQPIADIVIRTCGPRDSIFDCFVETEAAYDRIMEEAPGYGEMYHFDEFIRVFVAPTFDPAEVKKYLERK